MVTIDDIINRRVVDKDAARVEELLEEARGFAREIQADPALRELPEAKRAMASIQRVEEALRDLHRMGIFQRG